MESTREKRGKGIRLEVAGRNKLPRADFLHDSGNKRQVFSFLSNKLVVLEYIEGKQIFTSGTTLQVLVTICQNVTMKKQTPGCYYIY